MVCLRKSRINKRACYGQAMVEFALAVPLLLLFIVAIIYFGRAFYIKQIVSMAAQEGAKVISRLPGLNDGSTRDFVKGFSTDGQALNSNSIVYSALASGKLLSEGTQGNLPPGASVKVLPWDSDGSPEDTVPTGTVALKIEYPYTFPGSPFAQSESRFSGDFTLWQGWGGGLLSFPNTTIAERAVVSQEVFQEVN